jgi:hypothetical protein
VDEILGARYSGPALPVLQLVCLGLFEDANRHGQSLIAKAGYGGVEGQIIEHIRGTIRALYPDDEEFQSDIDRIREFLVAFYIMQSDGSVVARTHELVWVTSELGKLGLRVVPSRLIEALASPQTMVFRALRNVKPGGNIVDELTLGHDSVALALERWKALDAEKRPGGSGADNAGKGGSYQRDRYID